MATPAPLPPGSDAIAAWARGRGLRYQPYPDADWYRAWEPFETMVAPAQYFNAVEVPLAGARAVLAEPWSATGDGVPLGRTVIAFVTDPRFTWRASARVGASHLTRVRWLGAAPPKQRQTGDVEWDDVALTFAKSPLEAVRAFTPSLRKLLLAWKFEGHMELREGGFVLHVSEMRPTAKDYERLAGWLPMVSEKGLKAKG